MPTGACGINCDTCRLRDRGVCSSCGGGTSEYARLKLEAQLRLLGAPCPILACARLNRLDYCMADCDQFPCENFSSGLNHGYPYSNGFIAMQKRRRNELDSKQNKQDQVDIADQHWLELNDIGTDELQRRSGAVLTEDGWLQLEVFNRVVRINIEHKTVEWQKGQEPAGWKPAPSLLAFVSVVYLKEVRPKPLAGHWVTEKDLSCSEFFRGIHQLRVDPVLHRFGDAPRDFIRAGEGLGGVQTADSGDAALRLWVFPAIPLKLILWCRDEELDAALTMMFDRSIDELLPGDAIWALAQLVCEALARQADGTF
jgi:hypothetical protein